jgi:hypothetical protein
LSPAQAFSTSTLTSWRFSILTLDILINQCYYEVVSSNYLVI